MRSASIEAICKLLYSFTFALPGNTGWRVVWDDCCWSLSISSDTPVSELSLELLLLQVVLPALLEQGHTRQWLKALIRVWCVMASWLLNLRSYLLGDVPLDEVSSLLYKWYLTADELWCVTLVTKTSSNQWNYLLSVTDCWLNIIMWYKWHACL